MQKYVTFSCRCVSRSLLSCPPFSVVYKPVSCLLLKTSLRLWFLSSPPMDGSTRPEGKLHQMWVNVLSADLTYCQTGCPSEQMTLFLFWLVSYLHLIWISKLRPICLFMLFLFHFKKTKQHILNVLISLIFLFSLANSLSPSVCVCLLISDKD